MTHAKSSYDRLRSWLPALPLLMLLAGTYWLNQQVQPIAPKPDDSKRHDVDFSVENLSSVTLDENGKPRYLMTTEKMWHYPDDDSTYLRSPHFVSLQPNRDPHITTALTGKVSRRGDEVFLYDNVSVMRLSDLPQNQLTFRTEYLHILPDKDQADTDYPVTVISERDTVEAVGMTLDNKLQTAHLLSHVRAIHVPPAQ